VRYKWKSSLTAAAAVATAGQLEDRLFVQWRVEDDPLLLRCVPAASGIVQLEMQMKRIKI
jgi:hypothetical protein